MLTASSAYDTDIVNKLKDFVAKGGKAIVTSGFVLETLERGLKDMTSIRFRGRHVSTKDFVMEHFNKWTTVTASEEISFPVMEFRNNSTWGALCKGLKNEESFTLLSRDTYGDGQMMMITVPDNFSTIRNFPKELLTRLRKEFEIDGITLDGDANISLFPYDSLENRNSLCGFSLVG